jgi:hypothetical protein
MTIKEILEKEAYEGSACLFCSFIRPYQAKRVYYKNIDRVVLSVGFPSHLLDNLMENPELHVTEISGIYKITGDRIQFSPELYSRFKEDMEGGDIVQRSQGVKEDTAPGDTGCRCAAYGPVIDELMQFNIADSSPVDCMLFLNSLKKKIHG